MSSLARLKRTRPAAQPGIVHFGPGAFFRSFLAPYTDELSGADADGWGIVAVSLKSRLAYDQLVPQSCVYTAMELGPAEPIARSIEVISDILVAPDNPAAIVTLLVQPQINILSLTITEKGYCHNPSNGKLNLDHPDIQHDMMNLESPRSAIGFIVSALQKRRDAGVMPFTVLCCDNLPANGQMVRALTIEFAACLSSDLADWIADEVSFPNTMVDRITPATTDDNFTYIETNLGYSDPALIIHEPFRQWVIEDTFTSGRPAWERAGAQFVCTVEAHELMKLRCLNGTHSTLAYLGYLAGFETVADCMEEPAFVRLCSYLWQAEILPTLPQPEGEDLDAYCASLLARYQNPSIRHKVWQIAMDGSQKLPQRILGTLYDQLAQGVVPNGLCLVIAAWMIYVGGIDETGAFIHVRDPLASDLKEASQADDPVYAFLSMPAIFDASLLSNEAVVSAIRSAYHLLKEKGALEAVRMFVENAEQM